MILNSNRFDETSCFYDAAVPSGRVVVAQGGPRLFLVVAFAPRPNQTYKFN